MLWVALRSLAILSLIATLCVLLARTWWFFDLFANFRIQLFATQLLLLMAVIVLRRPAWAMTIGIACSMNGLAVRNYIVPDSLRHQDTSDVADIRVLNANVRASNTAADGIIALLNRVQPDVFAILEFTDHLADAMRPLDQRYPHRVLVPQNDNFGIAVFSRWPFANTELFDLGGYTAIDVQIMSTNGNWHFIAAHPVPPIGAELARLRNRQLEQLAQRLSAMTTPRIVVGDFNLAPFSPHFADFIDQTGLDNALRGKGPSFTWPSFFLPLGIPIDHVMTSAEFEVTRYFREQDIGSDHFPVVVDVNRRRNRLDLRQ